LVFVPDSITINLGDSVSFSLTSIHNAIEVSQATWLANGNTSNGGFQVPFGGGLVLPAQLGLGVHYYVCSPHAAMGMKGRIFVINANSVRDDQQIGPKDFQLFQNYPNPFNPSTTIEYQISLHGNVNISIYNSLGQLVRVLYSGDSAPGTHSILWDSKNDRGVSVTSGIYFYQIKIDELIRTKKALLIR